MQQPQAQREPGSDVGPSSRPSLPTSTERRLTDRTDPCRSNRIVVEDPVAVETAFVAALRAEEHRLRPRYRIDRGVVN